MITPEELKAAVARAKLNKMRGIRKPVEKVDPDVGAVQLVQWLNVHSGRNPPYKPKPEDEPCSIL